MRANKANEAEKHIYTPVFPRPGKHAHGEWLVRGRPSLRTIAETSFSSRGSMV
jgi:hypothetical protein